MTKVAAYQMRVLSSNQDRTSQGASAPPHPPKEHHIALMLSAICSNYCDWNWEAEPRQGCYLRSYRKGISIDHVAPQVRQRYC